MKIGAHVIDKGYRGHDTENPRRVFISGQKRGVFGAIKRELRRRSAIEAVIGHLKTDGHLGRCYLKGPEGDAANAVLGAVGHNLRLVLAWLRALMCLILIVLRKTLSAPQLLATSLNSDVVDQACFAKSCSDEQAKRPFLEGYDRCQRQGVARLKIVQGESGQIHFNASHVQNAVDLLAVFDARRTTFEDFVKHRGDRPLRRRKVRIARGEGQAVRLAHRRNSDNLHQQIEILG